MMGGTLDEVLAPAVVDITSATASSAGSSSASGAAGQVGSSGASGESGSMGADADADEYSGKTDEEIAQMMQRKYDAGGLSPVLQPTMAPTAIAGSGGGDGGNGGGGGGSTSVSGGNRPRSDSDFARELQAQFDAAEAPPVLGIGLPDPNAGVGAAPGIPGVAAAAAVAAPTLVLPASSVAMEGVVGMDVEGGGSAGGGATRAGAAAESATHASFELFHYNGLQDDRGREARLARLTLKRPVLVSSVGRSISIDAVGSTSGGHGSAIEEVLRTRWGAAATVDCHGEPMPSID
jgi:hypothetical protein